MGNSMAAIEASLASLEEKLVAEVAEYKSKHETAARELRRVRTVLRTAGKGGVENRFVKKVDFLRAARTLLADNGGQLSRDELMGLAKHHLKEAGYSLAGVDLHVDKYLRGDDKLAIAADGTVALKNFNGSAS